MKDTVEKVKGPMMWAIQLIVGAVLVYGINGYLGMQERLMKAELEIKQISAQWEAVIAIGKSIDYLRIKVEKHEDILAPVLQTALKKLTHIGRPGSRPTPSTAPSEVTEEARQPSGDEGEMFIDPSLQLQQAPMEQMIRKIRSKKGN